ncbi:MAG: hypothetical protein AAF917_07395, partial [Pseudomonadota bacterium]
PVGFALRAGPPLGAPPLLSTNGECDRTNPANCLETDLGYVQEARCPTAHCGLTSLLKQNRREYSVSIPRETLNRTVSIARRGCNGRDAHFRCVPDNQVSVLTTGSPLIPSVGPRWTSIDLFAGFSRLTWKKHAIPAFLAANFGEI